MIVVIPAFNPTASSMKKIHLLFVVGILLVTVASCSKVSNKEMTVIKDCTGSYLRFNDKDYHICNVESVINYESGTEVKASFERINNCPEDTAVTCDMLHINEGWVRVTNIE